MTSLDRPTTAPGVGPDDPRLRDLLERLTLEEKVRVLTGRDMWSTWPLPSIGLRSIVLSDGPSGVRGAVWDERSPSLNLPSATALSSSWDLDLAHRYGAAAAVEARRKDVDVVLGPTINLHRSPLGGRHFEAFSEDPLLTRDLAWAVVRGLQDNGVGATPKHYVANDFETERFTADVRVSERALREVYLLAFERAVAEAGAWLVMSAYNSINGTTASEHDLLEDPLNTEWGFDGVVVSDWTAVRSLAAAEASQDLVMPGPDGPWGDALVAAVRDGRIDEAHVDRKVLRLLALAARVGALEGFEPPVQPAAVDGRAVAHETAVAGMVLARNEGLLPVAPDEVRSVAVIGHNAVQARTQGGGSATVVPASVVTPLDGVRAAFPDAVVTWAMGAVVQEGVAPLDPDEIENPVTGAPGARVRFLGPDGEELFAEDRFATELVYVGGAAPVTAAATLELHTRWTPRTSGAVDLGCAMVGDARVYVDGELAGELSVPVPSDDPGAAILGPPSATTRVTVDAGRPVDVRVEFERDASGATPVHTTALTLGTQPVVDPDAALQDATAAAAAADLAIVVVGTNSRVESEGHDRTTLALPGRQDDLVAAVAAANDRTVVVVNAGSPVLLPWRDDVGAILLGWFGGQEFGAALGDVLTGAAEPGGRLPTTWPARTEDVPVLDVTPTDGVLRYDEGIHVGHRAWLRTGTEPAYAFGHGLGYTTWQLGEPEIAVAGDGEVTITVPVTNSGDRTGRTVIQVYASRDDSAVDRPVRWLVGFALVHADAGATEEVTVQVGRRRFAHFDDGWQVEPGTYQLHVGTAVDTLHHSLEATLA